MTPVERAAEVYKREPCARTFLEDLQIHLRTGYVFSTPTLFVMARPVRRDGDHSEIVNPEHVFTDPDTWHIYLMSGDMAQIWDYAPFDLPYVSFERGNRLRFWDNAKIKDKVRTLAWHTARFQEANLKAWSEKPQPVAVPT
jgi:hypothetical protein